jgi:hypothetical protein
MTWKIDHDYLNTDPKGSQFYIPSRVGTCGSTNLTEVKETVRFRLLDDDGEVYYGGWLHDDGECLNQESALSYGMHDAGCTVVEVKRDGSWVQEIA